MPYKDPEKHRAYQRGKWKRYSRENKSKIRAKNFRDRYGIEVEEYEALKKQQEGKCGICETAKRVLFVDHCHDTSKIRGLLCQNCNTGIGMLQDSIKVLRKAVQYLEKYERTTAKPERLDRPEVAHQVG